MRSKWGAFYMTDNPTYAKSYGGNKSVLNKMVITKKAKLADLIKPSDDLIKQIDEIISPKATGETIKIKKPDGSFVEVPKTKGGLSNPVHSSADIIQGIKDGKAYYAEMPEVKEALKKLGYDGMITQESKFGVNYGVWNKDVIKTKSQLTEIWNKANKSTLPKPSIEPLIEEAKKYKSAEEFVKENSIKHISQEQVLPKKQGDIQFYHGTDVLNYDKLSIPKFEGSTMDRNYGDYFYITPDRSLTETYGRYSAGFNIPKEKVLPLEKYRSLWNAEKGTGISEKAFDDKLFKDYWAIEMPDNEFIVKDVSKIRDYTKSQLTDIWNKANKKPLLPSKPKPKKQPIKYVPVEKPVDLRKKITTESIVAKPSIPQRIKAESIKSGLEDVFGDIEYYNKVSVKSQAEETAKLINEDYDRAIRIAMGQENAPGDLLPESVLIGVKNQAIKSGDTELLINLATAEGGVARESTVLGQRIKMLDEGLEDDAFRNIKKVVSERRNNYQKKTGKSVDKAIKQETDKIKEAIKKQLQRKMIGLTSLIQ